MQYADGWRLDVGADVDTSTINDPQQLLEGVPQNVKFCADGYITGEEWGLANSCCWAVMGRGHEYQFSSAVLSSGATSTFTDNDHTPALPAGELALLP